MNNELIEQPSWWKRNWKWALPTGGCLGIVIIFIAVIFFGVSKVVSSVKEQTNYDDVLAQVQQNEQVISVLGEPIEQNGIGSYNISIKNGDRSANAVIPIKGPKGEAEIYITMSGEKEDPVYEKLEVYFFDTDKRIDLRNEGALIEASEDI